MKYIFCHKISFDVCPSAFRRLSSAADAYHLDDALHGVFYRAKIQQLILIFSHTSWVCRQRYETNLNPQNLRKACESWKKTFSLWLQVFVMKKCLKKCSTEVANQENQGGFLVTFWPYYGALRSSSGWGCLLTGKEIGSTTVRNGTYEWKG